MQIGLNMGMRMSQGLTSIQRAISLLRQRGSNAHVWLPGVGSLNGLQTANYLLSDASTGLAPVDQYVGRVNDAMGALGPELAGASFSSTTGWTGATGSVTASGAVPYTTCQNIGYTPISANKTYVITYSVVVVSGSVSLQFFGYAAQNTNPITVSGTYSQHFTPVEVKYACQPQAGGSGFTGTVSALSIREVTGIHATQPTTANKPKLVRGAVNLLTYSGDFSNSIWGKQEVSITPNTHIGYDGVLNASTLTVTTTADPFLVQTVTLFQGFTQIVLVKQGGSNPSPMTCLRPITIATAVQDDQLFFDFATKTFSFTGDLSNYGYLELSDGWFALFANNPTAAGQTLTQLRVCPWGSDGPVVGQTMLIQCAAIFQGTYTASEIQALGGIPVTTTAPASTVNGPYAWRFDGGDLMVLSDACHQVSDDFALIVGASCNNKAVYPQMCTAAVGPVANVGMLYFDQSGLITAYYLDDDSVATFVTGSTFTDGAPVVAAHLKRDGICRTDVDAVVGTPQSVPAGSFTVSSGGIGYGLDGDIAICIAIKGYVSDGELLLLKKLAASFQGRSL